MKSNNSALSVMGGCIRCRLIIAVNTNILLVFVKTHLQDSESEEQCELFSFVFHLLNTCIFVS